MKPVMRHADHDPDLVCRPAMGNGLCEPLLVKPDEFEAIKTVAERLGLAAWRTAFCENRRET